MRLIILDTETTGLSPQQGHRIVEVGVIEMVNRRLTGRTFHYYLHPDRNIDPGAQAVHGITLEFLKDKPRFPDIAKDLKEFVQDAAWVIHNAPFDLGFLDHEFKRMKDKTWEKVRSGCEIIDTLPMARKMHPGQRNNLDALCKRYGVNNQHREKHGALLDAEILADVYLLMTGGQDTFMLDEASEVASPITTVDVNSPREKIQSGVVIHATAEELGAHEAMMKLLQ